MPTAIAGLVLFRDGLVWSRRPKVSSRGTDNKKRSSEIGRVSLFGIIDFLSSI